MTGTSQTAKNFDPVALVFTGGCLRYQDVGLPPMAERSKVGSQSRYNGKRCTVSTDPAPTFNPMEELEALNEALELAQVAKARLKDPQFPQRMYAPLKGLLDSFRRYCEGKLPEMTKVVEKVGDGRTCTLEQTKNGTHIIGPDSFLWMTEMWLNRADELQHRKRREAELEAVVIEKAIERLNELKPILKRGKLPEEIQKPVETYVAMFQKHLDGGKTASRPFKPADYALTPGQFLDLINKVMPPAPVEDEVIEKVAA